MCNPLPAGSIISVRVRFPRYPLCFYVGSSRYPKQKKERKFQFRLVRFPAYFGGPMWLGFFMGWNSINLRQNHNPSKFETKFQVPISAFFRYEVTEKNPDSTFEFQKFRWGGMMITRPTTAWARCHWSHCRTHESSCVTSNFAWWHESRNSMDFLVKILFSVSKFPNLWWFHYAIPFGNLTWLLKMVI